MILYIIVPCASYGLTRMNNPGVIKKLVFSCCGLGYAPIVPGSFGTLGGVMVWILIPTSWGWHAAIIGSVAILALWSIGYAQETYHSNDPQVVVIDEVIGFLVAAWCVQVSLKAGLAAYVLFRVFDILKIAPARRMERISGPWGVILDDVCAGI